MPALLSSAIYLILFHTLDLEEDGNEIMDHPYPMGALVGAFTFLLSFRCVGVLHAAVGTVSLAERMSHVFTYFSFFCRANFAYNRVSIFVTIWVWIS